MQATATRLSEPSATTDLIEGAGHPQSALWARGRGCQVSVAEITPRGEQFDRTPPHDVAAEQCVLGGMLMSKDAISDVMETISAQDHYRPAHQLVHEAILELYGRGEPADAVTVSDLLNKRGDLARVGGGTYLHTLIASVPTAANAGYYARIVRERAILRRLVEVGTRIVQLGYSGDGDADELVDRAQAEVYGVTEHRISEDYLALSEIMPGALDEIEAIGSRGGGMTGVPTGFADLDALTNGLHAGQMIVIAARPAIGKALAVGTPLVTPTGWTTMGEVSVGDRLMGAGGKPVTVVAATEVMQGRPCYEVEFSDGEVILADGQHQWITWDLPTRKAYDYHREPGAPAYPEDWATWASSHASRFRCSPGTREQMRALRTAGMSSAEVASALGRTRSAVLQQWNRSEDTVSNGVTVVPRTTMEIASTLQARGMKNHAIPAAYPLVLPEADLPFEPYALGYLLGDGDTAGTGRVACDPRDRAWVVDELLALGHNVGTYVDPGHFGIRGIRDKWRSLGLAQVKHVPGVYLRSSFSQRLALAQGLVDSDGYVDAHGAYRFTNTNKRLVDDFVQLVTSLGCIAQVHDRGSRLRAWRPSRESWEVIVPTSLPLARLPRKALAGRREWKREQVSRFIVDVRPVPSVPVRCVQVDSADHLYLAGRSMIPTHNSTLALDLARAAAVKHSMATVMFSLEMSRNEITMRLLSAEARVPLHTMRTGQMGDEDWTRLARRMSEVVDAPLFIDDSPNMSMMEIRAKCRRLKQRHDLKMVIIDYLQLMSSPRRVENRQQEVSEMSRSLKLLAKEIDVPVIAISQLNRGPEQRTDKRPLLSDLRESGCLTARTRIMRADTGAEISLGELMASGERDVPVWSLDEGLRLVPRTMTHAFASGTKEVFRVQLKSGREVEATASHPFLTYAGWRPLAEIPVGGRVAVPRHTPAPLVPRDLPESEIIMLGHLLGDGSFVRNQPIRYASIDEANLAAVTAAAKHFGITAIRDEYAAARCTSLRLPAPHHLTHGRRNPTAAWLDSLGLFGLRSHEKFIPAPVFSVSKPQLALFLHHLWATDGCIWWDAKVGQARIYYASTSRRLVDDVARLLLRFNVMTRVKETRKGTYRPCYHLYIYGAENQLRFLEDIGVHGNRSVMADAARAMLISIKGNMNLDTIPREVWDRVRTVLAERQMSHRQFATALGTQFCGSTPWKRSPSRARLSRVATILDDAELEMVATNDVFWDEITSVESLGEQPVYDATVLGTHNFVADGISLHNSIEQDSDVVILLHREDAYERESPRAGEADLIVAKHRNGPTATVTVAFQGHYSRFVDMAPG
jgi:replicative DNA helicase